MIFDVADLQGSRRCRDCMYSGERAGVVGALLTGLNSSGGVIIVADAGRFKGVEDRKHAGVVGVLLDVVFDVADL